MSIIKKFSAEKEAKELLKCWSTIWKRTDPGKNQGRNRAIFGSFFEGLVIEFIKKKLKDNFKVKGGLIRTKLSFTPQIDIIIYSSRGLYESNITSNAVVDAKNVKMIIEAKSYLDKPGLKNLKIQIGKFKKLMPSVKTCVFVGTLATPIKKEDIKTIFNFADCCVILYRKERQKEIYDFGGGLKSFVDFLKLLK